MTISLDKLKGKKGDASAAAEVKGAKGTKGTKASTKKSTKPSRKSVKPPPSSSSEDDSDDDDYETEDEDDDEFEDFVDDDEDEEEEKPSKEKSHKSKSSKLSKTPKKNKRSDEEVIDDVIAKFLERKLGKESEKEPKKKAKKPTRKPAAAPKNRIRPVIYDTEDEDDTEDDDYDTEDEEEDDDDESTEEDDDPRANRPCILMLSNGSAGNDDGAFYDACEDAEVEEMIENNEEYGSEDESHFMKESYQSFVYPKEAIEAMQKVTKSGKSKKNQETNKTNKPPTDEPPKPSVEEEYRELIDLKRHLAEKLQKNPDSKILLNTMKECCDSISKLVKDARVVNAKDYYQLIKVKVKDTMTELEYFKKKLSHKEQKAVMDELASINHHANDDRPYRLTLLQSKLPTKHKVTVLQKLNMMQSMEPGDTEYHKMKTWVDAFMRIPFHVYKSLTVKMSDGMDTCNQFMRNAKTQLDECVYGLDDAKFQILQMMGQWVTNPDAMGSAIAICGPPGTGKTSLAKEGISKILGREFSFMALGGAGDGSVLEGHSYTYEGSTWGRIVQILMDSKCMNPVIYFDELDKLSDSARGQEITGILTHLTDKSQNSQFHDKYFSEVDFDLSKCLFIFSYNDENNVNPILRDRMYKIKTKGYDCAEKVIIAKKYILPKIREQVNFQEGDIVIPDDVLQYIISSTKFTNNEQGVRNLGRCLEVIYTKLNLFRLMSAEEGEKSILGKNVVMDVTFPYTVSKKDVDILIRPDENQNPSLLMMYV